MHTAAVAWQRSSDIVSSEASVNRLIGWLYCSCSCWLTFHITSKGKMQGRENVECSERVFVCPLLSLLYFPIHSPQGYPSKKGHEAVAVNLRWVLTMKVHLKLLYKTSLDREKSPSKDCLLWLSIFSLEILQVKSELLRHYLSCLVGRLKGRIGKVWQQRWRWMHHFSILKWAQCHHNRATLHWGHCRPVWCGDGDDGWLPKKPLLHHLCGHVHTNTNIHSKSGKYIDNMFTHIWYTRIACFPTNTWTNIDQHK